MTDEQRMKNHMEEAAQSLVHKHYARTGTWATWQWLDDKSLRIWNADGSPMMTLHVESVQ